MGTVMDVPFPDRLKRIRGNAVPGLAGGHVQPEQKVHADRDGAQERAHLPILHHLSFLTLPGPGSAPSRINGLRRITPPTDPKMDRRGGKSRQIGRLSRVKKPLQRRRGMVAKTNLPPRRCGTASRGCVVAYQVKKQGPNGFTRFQCKFLMPGNFG